MNITCLGGMRILVPLLAVAIAGAGEPDSGLELRGVTAFPVAEVRRAIAADLPLLLARRPGAPPEEGLRELERAVVLGYREYGYRDAAATAAPGVLTVVEGPRTVCGDLQLRVPAELEAVIRRALLEPPSASEWDLDTVPQAKPAAWTVGGPVDWNAGERYYWRVQGALRDTGRIAETVTVAVQEPVGGTAALLVTLPAAPAVLQLGEVRVAGLPPDEAARLRAWLALPATAAADRALADAATERLRGSAVFIEAAAAWEDQSPAFPLGLMAAIPYNDFQQTIEQDHAAMRARVARRGRADLLVTVYRVPGAALPWEEGARERKAILAARARLLARLAAGADLLAEATVPGGGALRVVWSAAHGFAAIHQPPAGRPAQLALADGWLVSDGPAGRLRAPFLAPHIIARLRANPQQDGKDPFNFNVEVQGLAQRARLQLTLSPSAFVDVLLRPRAERPTRRAWDGEVLVLAYEGIGEARVDPASGVSLHLGQQAGGLRIALADGVWAREIAPVIAAARQPAERPLGTVLAEALAAVRTAAPMPAEAAGQLDRAVILARSGALDALVGLVGGLPGTDTAEEPEFDIPVPSERRPRLPLMQFGLAQVAASGDGMLSERLPESAWPRLLLRSTALAVSGDARAAAATLKPVMADRGAGPLACLVIAHAARLAGQEVLAGVLAEAGAARCDAAGLAREAEDLAGLAPALLPALAAGAETLAVVETDAARAQGLRELAAACTGAGEPAARLKTAARLATGLGAGEWLRQRLREVTAPPQPAP